MNTKTLKTILLSLISAHAMAQDAPVAPAKPWTNELQTGINLNQSSFSDNWTAGGVNSVAVGLFLNGKVDYKHNKHEWTNELQLQYGNVHNRGQSMRKTSDRIFFESKYSYKISDKWALFASANFMSQFDAGFAYFKLKDSTGKEFGEEKSRRISGFMAPAYLTEALGLEYKPVSYFSAQLGLGALRHTFVLDETLYSVPGNDSTVQYGVKRGDNIRNQAVFQFVANFDKEIMKNVTLKARYMALADYEKLNNQGVVQRLDASLIAKVNKYINVNLSTVLLYDFDQSKDWQYSQVLALGILYTLKNTP
ncbi:MAG: DUF3078 domain-containing protein [Bacteroidota bacterium]